MPVRRTLALSFAMYRRDFLKLLPLLTPSGLACAAQADGPARPREIRIGLTPVFLDDQLDFLKQLRAYFERRLGWPVSFVQRGSYREIVELVRVGKIDFAWLCGYPYTRYHGEMKLLAVPLYQSKPLYRSYLIVPSSDTRTTAITDLRGKVFAYSDPDSNSGYLYPQYSLLRAGANPASFFARTFFTWGHRKVVEAVGVGLAQGGAVDGYVWDTLARSRPELTEATRIAHRSPELGYPPFVARAGIPESEFRVMQRVLLGMRDDSDGAALLKTLNLDGFIVGDGRLFDGIAVMAKTLAERRP